MGGDTLSAVSALLWHKTPINPHLIHDNTMIPFQRSLFTKTRKTGLNLASAPPEVEVIRVVETEQPTVRSNRADSFIHARVFGKEVIVHLEIQTHDSSESPMPYRMAGYIGRCIEFFQLPVYSHVIYLHPRAGRTDPGAYTQEDPGYAISIPYKVIRLSDLEGSPVS